MVRPSISTDTKAIDELLTGAFCPSDYEARLRQLITHTGKYYEWVHLDDNLVVAHVLFSPATRDGQHIGYHLAPLSVHEDYRRMGIATKLINTAISSSALENESIFVLGDPKFYEMFGFISTTTAMCPYDEENQHFRALRWADDTEPFVIGYHSAFTEAGDTCTST